MQILDVQTLKTDIFINSQVERGDNLTDRCGFASYISHFNFCDRGVTEDLVELFLKILSIPDQSVESVVVHSNSACNKFLFSLVRIWYVKSVYPERQLVKSCSINIQDEVLFDAVEVQLILYVMNFVMEPVGQQAIFILKQSIKNKQRNQLLNNKKCILTLLVQ